MFKIDGVESLENTAEVAPNGEALNTAENTNETTPLYVPLTTKESADIIWRSLSGEIMAETSEVNEGENSEESSSRDGSYEFGQKAGKALENMGWLESAGAVVNGASLAKKAKEALGIPGRITGALINRIPGAKETLDSASVGTEGSYERLLRNFFLGKDENGTPNFPVTELELRIGEALNADPRDAYVKTVMGLTKGMSGLLTVVLPGVDERIVNTIVFGGAMTSLSQAMMIGAVSNEAISNLVGQEKAQKVRDDMGRQFNSVFSKDGIGGKVFAKLADISGTDSLNNEDETQRARNDLVGKVSKAGWEYIGNHMAASDAQRYAKVEQMLKERDRLGATSELLLYYSEQASKEGSNFNTELESQMSQSMDKSTIPGNV